MQILDYSNNFEVQPLQKSFSWEPLYFIREQNWHPYMNDKEWLIDYCPTNIEPYVSDPTSLSTPTSQTELFRIRKAQKFDRQNSHLQNGNERMDVHGKRHTSHQSSRTNNLPPQWNNVRTKRVNGLILIHQTINIKHSPIRILPALAHRTWLQKGSP